MKKKLHFKLLLLLCAMVMGIGSAWAEEVTIASFTAKDDDHGNWTITNADYATGGGGYYKLISSDASIVTPSINWTDYSNVTITISARKFGGPDATQGRISVSQEENELASYSPSGTSIVASSALSISPIDGTITISCPGASSNKGCGVQSIVIKGTQSGGGTTTTYTVTYDCNGGTSGCPENVTDVEAGTAITLADAPTKTDYTFDGWNDGNETYDAGDSYTVNGNVTLTAQWTANGGGTTGDGQWVLTDLADLVEGDVFVIVGNNGSTFAMSNDKGTGNPPSAIEVEIANNVITSTVAGNIQWNISGDATNGYTFYPNGDTENWLYCTNTNNGVRVGTNNANTFVISTEGYLYHNGTSRYIGIYNSQDWRCYTSINSNIKDQTFAFYKKVISGVTPPSISAYNVDLAYDATSGSITYTINNGVEGGTVSASTEADWLTIGTVDETIPFTCSANTEATERTATVTLTYAYGDNETVTKNVTVTQAGVPVISSYSTIPDLFAAATSTETGVNVTFDSWVVSGVSTNGKNVFVTDNNGNGFVIYSSSDMSNTYSAGSILSGTVSCKLKLYNGFAELLEVDANDLTITSGGAVTAANITMANLAGVNTGALVSYTGLTCSVDNNKYYLSDGITTLQVYNSLYAFEALEDGKIYNITGIFQQYGDTKEILPRSEADIEEVVGTAPTLTVDDADKTVNVDAAGTITNHEQQTIKVNFANFTTAPTTSTVFVEYCDANGEAMVTSGYEWINSITCNWVSTDYFTMACSIAANTGDARTAYAKVYAVDGETTVYSDLITIIQAKYVTPDVEVDPAVAGVGAFVKVTSTEDITAGNYLIVYEDENVAFDGSLSTLDAANNTIAVSIVEGKIPATYATVAAVFTIKPAAGTIKSASGYYIGVPSFSNGLKQSEDADAYTNAFSINDEGNAIISASFASGVMILNYNSNKSDKRFRYYKNGSQKAIQLYKYDAAASEVTNLSISISNAGYATYCSADALDFSNTGLTAYKATISTDNKVSFTEVTEVPAGEGVLLKGDAGTYQVPMIATAEAIENDFIGVTRETKVAAGIFVLMNGEKGVGFYKTTKEFTVGAHTAYLPALTDETGTRNFIGFDQTTGINTVNGEESKMNGYYNLNGQRVDNPQKGLYIVNGKKVMVK